MTTATPTHPDAALWDAHEKRAWKPRRREKPSQWAERNYVLPRDQSNTPGPWRNDNSPYLRLFMDLAVAPGVEEYWLEKAAQGGGSEAMRIIILYFAANDPSTLGLCLPDRAKGRQIVQDRMLPAIRRTKATADLMTERSMDASSEEIRLANGTRVILMWSGSASSLASNPIRIVVLDEIDKMKAWTAKEGSPVDLAAKRTRTFGSRRRVIGLSTPTLREGEIHRRVEGCPVILYFFCPCPHCGVYQRLVFPQLKWEKVGETQAEKAGYVLRTDGAVWYECAACGKRIEEIEKPAMIRAGMWRTEDGAVADAEAVEKWPRGTRIGMRINALYYLQETWRNIAAEFIESAGDLPRLYAFWTSTLGEPYEHAQKKTSAMIFSEKSRRAKLAPGIVPTWAGRLLAAVDTQHDHFWMVVRAFSRRRSARVWHGRVENFAQLDELIYRTQWRVENDQWGPIPIDLAAIDTGGTAGEADMYSRTKEVYEWGRVRMAKVRMFKGDARPKANQVIRPGTGLINPGGGAAKEKVTIWLLDSHYWQTLLEDQIHLDLGEGIGEAWLLNNQDDPVYNNHLSGLHRVPVLENGKLVEYWQPTTAGGHHDLRDCEAYLQALASLANVDLLPDEDELHVMREKQADEVKKIKERGRSVRPNPWKPQRLKL